MKYKVNIISHKRPQNVQRPIYQTLTKEINYYVGKNESAEYYNAGAKNVIESGRFTESLNCALADCKEDGCDCVIMDDDLKTLQLAVDKKEPSISIQIKDAILEMQNVLYKELRSMHFLAGVAPTDNIFYFNPNKRISFHNFIISSFIYIRKDTDLIFDTQFGTNGL